MQAPKSLSKLTVSKLEEFLQKQYSAHLQSLSVGDMLLYADFLPSSEELLDLPLDALIRRTEEEAVMDIENDQDSRTINTEVNNSSILRNSFIDLEVVCVDDGGNDLRLPSVRVFLQIEKESGGSRKNVPGIGGRVAGAGKKMLSWMRRKN